MRGEGLSLCIDGDNHLLQTGVFAILTQNLPEAMILLPGHVRRAQNMLLILCVESPDIAGRYIEKHRAFSPELKTILLYNCACQADPLACLNLGCCAVRKNGLSGPELLDCIRLVKDGVFVWEDELAEKLLNEVSKYHIFLDTLRREIHTSVPTERELEIAKCILHGLGNEEIGRRLFISTGTVKNYIAAILEKYDFRSRAQIVSLLSI